MKKLLLSAFMLVAVAFSAEAQDKKNAIGLRIGDNDGFGGEVSYQRWLDTDNRLEFDLGWRDSRHYDAVKLAALYQWVWNIDGGFNWYAGVGGGLGTWEYNDHDHHGPDWHDHDDNGTFGFVAGDIGIEYNFPFPLQLSLDFRPEVYFGGDDFRDNNFGPDIALGVRFRF
ncbi:MAG: outer membrane protein [Flavobacterium sp.]